ncbi:hypothetical protein ACFL0B_03415 [Thermodesulfobacteriota bacterium]
MNTIKNSLKNFPVRMIFLGMILCFTAVLHGCEKSPDRAKPPETKDWDKADFAALEKSPDRAKPPETKDWDKADFAALVKETDRMLSGGVKDGKSGEMKQETALTKTTTSLEGEAAFESGMADHQLNFYFPTPQEENNYLEILGKSICDAETVARRRKESEGLVSCATWKARLKKAKTLIKMDISKYESGGKAWEAIDRMRSTGGFIAGNVILAGDEEWPETIEGQIEARSFIKSYYGRIRPTYVYKNEMGKPEEFLLDNDRALEALQAGE